MKEKVSKKFQEIYGTGAILFASPGRINRGLRFPGGG